MAKENKLRRMRYADRVSHVKLVAAERPVHNASGRAALIVYHDVHTASAADSLPPWARSAQRIALALSRVLQVVLTRTWWTADLQVRLVR